jgi:thiol-disulfide isomerase/thioredoxin
MKKFIVMAAAAVMAVSCVNNSYVIEGQLEGAEDQTIFLMNEKGEKSDSTAMVAGAFKFEGEVEKPALMYLAAERPFAIVYIENGTIAVKGSIEDPQSITVSGTTANDARTDFNAFQSEFMAGYREAASEVQDSLVEVYYSNIRERVAQNADNLFGVKLYLSELSYDATAAEMLEQVEKFSPEMQLTDEVVKLKELATAKANVEVGKPYIEVVQNNMEGEPVALSSVVGEGKYVLLDFWASWCGPCMREVPYLVDAYKQYHSKGFEIYGVSFDRAREPWLKAIEEKDLDWLHVSAVNYWDNKARHDYAVNSIPANFLVDCSTGQIIAKGLRGEQVVEKMGELLK